MEKKELGIRGGAPHNSVRKDEINHFSSRKRAASGFFLISARSTPVG